MKTCQVSRSPVPDLNPAPLHYDARTLPTWPRS